MALSVTQVMSGGLSRAIENEYDSRKLSQIAEIDSVVSLSDKVFVSDLRSNPISPLGETQYRVGDRAYVLDSLGKPVLSFRNESKKIEVGFSYESYRSFVHGYALDWAIRLFLGLCILIAGFLVFMQISILRLTDF